MGRNREESRAAGDGSVRRLHATRACPVNRARTQPRECAFRGECRPSIPAVMGEPDQCPACESVQLERRGGKDFCPRCHYIQPCCDGGLCT